MKTNEESIIFNKNSKINTQDESLLLTLYHGSDKILEKPEYGKGKKNNDYGLGFYTTPSQTLAAEWAVPNENIDGYVNAYQINTSNLSILYLDDTPFEYWITVLIQNRAGQYADAVVDRQKRWMQNFPVATTPYDMIRGWRADDAYFSFVRDFFLGLLSLENLKLSLKFGDLGIQYAIMSQNAFELLEFVPPAKKILSNVHYPMRKLRDDNARQAYHDLPNKGRGTLLFDIVGRD